MSLQDFVPLSPFHYKCWQWAVV